MTTTDLHQVWFPPGRCTVCTKQATHAHSMDAVDSHASMRQIYLDQQKMLQDYYLDQQVADSLTTSWLEAYRRTPIGNPAASSLGGMIAANVTHVEYTPAVSANVCLEPLVTVRNYAQGMARGSWWGKAAGPHPGYQMVTR